MLLDLMRRKESFGILLVPLKVVCLIQVPGKRGRLGASVLATVAREI
jgi:hypothetical protein